MDILAMNKRSKYNHNTSQASEVLVVEITSMSGYTNFNLEHIPSFQSWNPGVGIETVMF